MEVIFEACAGLDVHKRSIAACVNIKGKTEVRSFGTTTQELLELSDWLGSRGVTHVGMESTGVYWKPVYNILEESFDAWVLNAQHIKAVPGRKTDVRDAEWISNLMRHGLVRASFVPPKGQRQLRELVRHRTNFVRERVNLVNRVQKVLEGANIKLGDVATDVMGISGRLILQAIVTGETDSQVMAQLAKGKLRKKMAQLEQALAGRVSKHHRFLLSELLCQIDSLDETIERFNAEIAARSEPDEELVELLDTIPGVSRQIAEVILAEVGTEMSRFPTDEHLCSWAGLCPGNNESAGKQLSARVRKGNTWLRTVLVQAAHAASRKKHCYLASEYRRLKARRGSQKAVIAVAHSILKIVYWIISRRQPYRELEDEHIDDQRREQLAKRLRQRLLKLGFNTELVPVQPQPTSLFSG